MSNVITTQTINQGGGGLKDVEHTDGKIKVKRTRTKKK
jgi:hypothetical protein